MNELDFRTPFIYFLLLVIIALLVIIKRISVEDPIIHDSKDLNEDPALSIEENKTLNKKVENIKVKIVLIIDDFGYRNDEISDGFLNLNIKLNRILL